MSPSPPGPAHRGAARQMYGSGSLRPPGTRPIFATGRRQHGSRTTAAPQESESVGGDAGGGMRQRQYVPQIFLPRFPYPLPVPADEYARLEIGTYLQKLWYR